MTQVKAIRDEQGLHSIQLIEGDDSFVIPAPSIALVANDLIWHMYNSGDNVTVFAPRGEQVADDISN